MPDNNEYSLKENMAELPSNTPQPENQINLEHIQVNNISGPLVVLFGPRNVGKTVTLLRLSTYINKYDISLDENFRTDKAEYKKTVDAFKRIRQNLQFAPAATGNIDFLLLNVTYQGNRFCQILEAPGEHYFNAENPNKEYPTYLNQILNADYPKVFIFFFELNMFKSDQDRKNYADKIADLVKNRVSAKRNRVIIVCNKCDLQPFLRDGRPVESEYRNALYTHDSFNKLSDVLNKSGFGKIPFVPFSAGTFNDDGTGKLAFALSPEHFPQRLWREIEYCIHGSKPWWKFW